MAHYMSQSHISKRWTINVRWCDTLNGRFNSACSARNGVCLLIFQQAKANNHRISIFPPFRSNANQTRKIVLSTPQYYPRNNSSFLLLARTEQWTQMICVPLIKGTDGTVMTFFFLFKELPTAWIFLCNKYTMDYQTRQYKKKK